LRACLKVADQRLPASGHVGKLGLCKPGSGARLYYAFSD
jgi:hypothetical protein